jgi:hypothetical protein
MSTHRQSSATPKKQHRLVAILFLLGLVSSVAIYFGTYVIMGPKKPDPHGAVRYYRYEWMAEIFGPAAALESEVTGEFVNTGWWE